MPVSVGAGPLADGCTNLDAIPIQFTIDFQSAIQGVFDNHCIECHEGKDPPAGLDLSAGGSWSHLIGIPSSQDAAFIRVMPDQPLASLLFLKVNCDIPGVGHRMPLNRDPLLEEEQALMLDWIRQGAPSATTDTIFRGEFEIRG
ncbi:MAG: hypothetical protein ABIR62_00170 [Dokdonella sp.]|uniref:hypothetical protein n=1 Tax=Dokdonella sp. TaxID=2291710 RepID=UPI0032673FAC